MEMLQFRVYTVNHAAQVFLFGLLDGHQLKTAPLPFCICL